MQSCHIGIKCYRIVFQPSNDTDRLQTGPSYILQIRRLSQIQRIYWQKFNRTAKRKFEQVPGRKRSYYLGIHISISVNEQLNNIQMAAIYSPVQWSPTFTVCNYNMKISYIIITDSQHYNKPLTWQVLVSFQVIEKIVIFENEKQW